MSDTPKNLNWPGLAAVLGARFSSDSIESSALACLRAAGTRRVLVACSGGADSVFMLCWLFARRAELGLELYVAHYNHRWRGGASDLDADCVREMARALDLGFYLGQRPEKEAAFTETTARGLRVDFLRKTALELGCGHIAFGHQLDDILETQLQRLARGAGTDGLAAPRPVACFSGLPTHLRPLLQIRAGDIRMALNAIGIPWREDGSNKDTDIARNALRHEVIPDLIEALDRDPAVGAARSRRLMEEDASALEQFAREGLPEAFAGEDKLSRSKLVSLPRALMRRGLAAWLNAHGLIESLSAAALDLLIDTLLSGRHSSRQSAGSRLLCFDSEAIWIEDEASDAAPLQHVPFAGGESVVLSSGYVIDSEWWTLDEESRRAILRGDLDPSREAVLVLPPEHTLEVRGWRPGDRFFPLGAPGSKKLKDWFIDRRIPRKERKQLPIVTTDTGEVVWVPGFPPAERLKIDGETKQALRLTYRPRNSV